MLKGTLASADVRVRCLSYLSNLAVLPPVVRPLAVRPAPASANGAPRRYAAIMPTSAYSAWPRPASLPICAHSCVWPRA
jgi:hypothetical protein